MIPTSVYESYWRFAAERHAVYERRLLDPIGPWTLDPVLRNHRFTNVYRAVDRVSQYLIRDVQYRSDRSQAPAELFFRTILFKLFNKIETWDLIERQFGPISYQGFDWSGVAAQLDGELARGRRVYSAAYIMPSPDLGHDRKHTNHLELLKRMMSDGLPARIERAASLEQVYELVKAYPGIGPFLAFQYAIDLNYSILIDFEESDFVVAGPGALDGIAKCFEDAEKLNPSDVIYAMVENQDREFARFGLHFSRLFGRPLQPIDCQNIFCEISKYARVAHPEVRGLSGRTRIKQAYRQPTQRLETPAFPPKWGLTVPHMTQQARILPRAQGVLF